ncbi:MAG: GNAT family N-acetyltransferase [Nanoarchaeota archaeon]|nr:GNAT family N-acetyltransferase [Nanoarchaeota archaeon]
MITYRKINKKDASAIYILVKKDFASKKEYSWDWSTNEINSYLKPTELGIVAIEKNEIIGFILVKEDYASQRPHIAWLTYILIDEKHQGQGIASTLITKAEKTLKTIGKTEILTDIYATNKHSLSFFNHHKFTKKETWYSLSKKL